MFFVLSGYLITGLLFKELEASGTVRLGAFYARRLRRLLPASILLTVVVLGIGFLVLAPMETRRLAESAISSAVYVSNLYFAYASLEYLAADGQSNPLLHMWSLAVEEQFYLVWPVLMLAVAALSRKASSASLRARLIVLLLLVIVGSLGLSVWLTNYWQPWAFFLSPTRAFEFALGGLAALAPVTGGRWHSLLGWAGLAAIFGCALVLGELSAFPGWLALIPTVGTALALRSGGPLKRVLGSRILMPIGRLSYSWYLWHWPLIVFATAAFGDMGLFWRLVVMLVALAISEASFRLVENPIRHHPRLVNARPARSLVLAAVVSVAGVAAGGGLIVVGTASQSRTEAVRYAEARSDIPILYELGCNLTYQQIEPVPCVFGPTDAPVTIALVGDSHAAQWFPALHALTQERGWRLISHIKANCPPLDVKQDSYEFRRNPNECVQWLNAVWDLLEDEQPDMAFLAAYGAYRISDERWVESLGRTFERAGEVNRSVTYLRPTPVPGFDPLVCLARRAWQWWNPISRDCGFQTSPALAAGFESQMQLAEQFGFVHTLDLTDAVCPLERCSVDRDGLLVYRDNHHLTQEFVTSLAPDFARFVDELAGGGSASTGSR